MQESLRSSQTEIKEMQGLQDNNAEQRKTTETSLQRVQHELAELQRRHIKLECHSRRGNLKFFGIKEPEHESNEDLLRKFLRTDLKITKEDEESIQFDRVRRVSARRIPSGTPNSKPRPIIVKLSSFHDKSLLNRSSKTLRKAAILEFPTTFQRSTKSRLARKAYCIFQGRKANYRSVALPRPRDYCFPSLRTFNGGIS